MKIKKGDTVKLLGGKDKAKTGKVLRVIPESARIIVEGLNIGKKHRKARTAQEKGQIVEFPRSMSSSRALLVCPKCGKATRVGYVRSSEGVKSRQCHACKATFA